MNNQYTAMTWDEYIQSKASMDKQPLGMILEDYFQEGEMLEAITLIYKGMRDKMQARYANDDRIGIRKTDLLDKALHACRELRRECQGACEAEFGSETAERLYGTCCEATLQTLWPEEPEFEGEDIREWVGEDAAMELCSLDEREIHRLACNGTIACVDTGFGPKYSPKGIKAYQESMRQGKP